MANRRPPWKIPAVINPENRRCIQINIPDDPEHIAIFWGVLRGLSDWQRWEREETKSGTLVAKVWSEVVYAIEWEDSCMSCCPQPTNRRFNSAGQLEVSYDGGVTWVIDNSLDDRFSGVVSPPIAGEDGEEKRCIAATSGQEYVKQNLIDDLASGMSFAEMNSVAVAIIALLGVTGIGLLIAALGAAIFLASVTATQAAFTTGVWDDYKCILYCRASDDGSFTPLQWQQVKADVLATFTGVVSAVLYNWVNSVGPVGLTNSARSGFASSGDCSGCDCDCGGETIGLSMVNSFGSGSSATGCNVQADSEPDGALYSVTWIWDGVNPFKLTAEGLLSGVTGTSQWQWYDGTGAGPFFGIGAPVGGTLSFLELSGNAGTFRVSWDVITP